MMLGNTFRAGLLVLALALMQLVTKSSAQTPTAEPTATNPTLGPTPVGAIDYPSLITCDKEGTHTCVNCNQTYYMGPVDTNPPIGFRQVMFYYFIQYPTNTVLCQRYETNFTENEYIMNMLVLNDDEPFKVGSTTLPRTEIRTQSFSNGTGIYMLTTEFKTVCGADRVSILQMKLDGTDDDGDFACFFLSVYDDVLWYEKEEEQLSDGSVCDDFHQLNITFYTLTGQHEIYVDGVLKHTPDDRCESPLSRSFKLGVYDLSDAPYRNEIFFRNLQMYTTSDDYLVPTPRPTRDPTPEPTLTFYPTPEPSAAPSAEPSAEPTAAPSAMPTVEPTAMPSAMPTLDPTAEPSGIPTPMPSAVPTVVPTAMPSADPTPMPSAMPSVIPTPEPSAEPTITPGLPTAEPTASPTDPTAEPSVSPTPMPSSVPTPSPTADPSSMPTPSPSSIPTPMPSATPSGEPTPMPSSLPTPMPSAEPSSVPTPMPSAFPTTMPTAAPSSYIFTSIQTLSGISEATYSASSAANDATLQSAMATVLGNAVPDTDISISVADASSSSAATLFMKGHASIENLNSADAETNLRPGSALSSLQDLSSIIHGRIMSKSESKPESGDGAREDIASSAVGSASSQRRSPSVPRGKEGGTSRNFITADTLEVTYAVDLSSVLVGGTFATQEAAFAAYSEMVENATDSGEFTTEIQTFAATEGATDLETGVEAVAVTFVNTFPTPSPTPMPTVEKGRDDQGLTNNGIIVVSVVGFALVVAAVVGVYIFYVGQCGSNPTLRPELSRPPQETPLPDGLEHAWSGRAGDSDGVVELGVVPADAIAGDTIPAPTPGLEEPAAAAEAGADTGAETGAEKEKESTERRSSITMHADYYKVHPPGTPG